MNQITRILYNWAIDSGVSPLLKETPKQTVDGLEPRILAWHKSELTALCDRLLEKMPIDREVMRDGSRQSNANYEYNSGLSEVKEIIKSERAGL